MVGDFLRAHLVVLSSLSCYLLYNHLVGLESSQHLVGSGPFVNTLLWGHKVICEPASYHADSDAAPIDLISLLALNWFAKRHLMSFLLVSRNHSYCKAHCEPCCPEMLLWCSVMHEANRWPWCPTSHCPWCHLQIARSRRRFSALATVPLSWEVITSKICMQDLSQQLFWDFRCYLNIMNISQLRERNNTTSFKELVGCCCGW